MSSDPRTWHKQLFLQKATETFDTDGSVIEDWRDVRAFMGCLEPKKGSEEFSAQTLIAGMHYEIWGWDIPEATAKHRIRWGTRIFKITEPPYRYDEQGPAKMRIMAHEVE
jgi:head-tail adaptor